MRCYGRRLATFVPTAVVRSRKPLRKTTRSAVEGYQSMTSRPERRHVARITIPPQLSGSRPELQPVRLLDPSLLRARIEHFHSLTPRLLCLIDLPAALGRATLTGRVVWTRFHRHEHTLEGQQKRYYRTGVAWTKLTPE